jgi:hypothetical protein
MALIRTYRGYAQAFWTAIGEGDSELANRQTDAGDAIVAIWREAGTLEEALEPLLDDASAEVRYAAASDLLDSRASKHAMAVLEALQMDPNGLIAPTARLRLMIWRRDPHP